MTIQRALLITTTALLVAIIAARWQQTPTQHSAAISISPALKRAPNTSITPQTSFNALTIPPPVSQKLLNALQMPDNTTRYYPKTQRETLSSPNSYLPEEISIPLNPKVRNALSIDVNHQAISTLQAGDVISIVLPSGENIEAQVTHTKLNQSGAKTITAYQKEHGKDYPIIVTSHDNFTTATIPTPAGEYILEALNKRGWVYEPPDLNELIPANSTDALIPDISRRPLGGK